MFEKPKLILMSAIFKKLKTKSWNKAYLCNNIKKKRGPAVFSTL